MISWPKNHMNNIDVEAQWIPLYLVAVKVF